MWSRKINKNKSKKQPVDGNEEVQPRRTALKESENKSERVEKVSAEKRFNPVSQEIGVAFHTAEQEEIIQRNEEMFRKAFEAARDAILMVDKDGKIRLVNQSTEKMFGYCREELLGRSVDVLVPERFRSKHFEYRSDFCKDPRERPMGEGSDLFALRKDGSEFPVDISLNTIQTDEGLMILSFVKDLAEHRRADEELRRSEERYRALYDENPSMYFTVNTDGTIISVNHFGAEQLGYTVEELVGQPVLNVFYEKDRKAVQDRLNDYLQNPKKTANWEFRKVRKDGSLLWVKEFVRSMGQKDGSSVLLIVCDDITDRKQAEEAINLNVELLSKKNRYDAIMSAVTESVHRSINLQDVLENAVDSMKSHIEGVDNVGIYLVEGKEAVIRAYRGFHDEFIAKLRRIPYPRGFIWKTIREGKPRYCEDVDKDQVIGRIGREAGTKSYVSMPICSEGRPVGAIGISSFSKRKAFSEEELIILENVARQIEVAINNARQADALRVSEEALKKAKQELEHRVEERTRKLSEANKELRNEIKKRESAEERLKSSLGEKETLLMEIQHRVKNNLQAITSLLDLQKEYVKEKRVRNDFIEIQSRIRSMALIHEQIYQSKDLTKIDFAEYVTNVVTYLRDSYGMSSRAIKLMKKIGKPSLNVDKALACGMIVNELVSNSLKHAFPEGRRGEILIDLHPENSNCILIIGDDGIGFPKGLSFRKTKTLGLQLVMSLTRQIEGSIRLNRRGGTLFKIEFPEH